MHPDFVEMLSALSAAEAEFLVVGAHALAAHGLVRATGDLDIWIRPTPQNAQRVWTTLKTFGAPLDQLTEAELAETDLVFEIGVAPQRIDLLTSISGVEFEPALRNRTAVRIGDLTVPVLGRSDLIANKKASGRPRDVADVAELEAIERT